VARGNSSVGIVQQVASVHSIKGTQNIWHEFLLL